MTVTSLGFLVLVAAGAAVYYIVPKKLQWMELLVLSLVFYYFAGTPWTIVYLVASTAIAYISTMWVKRLRAGGKPQKTAFVITIAALVINILIWFIVKGQDLWTFILSEDSRKSLHILAALGMGYYTLQILGYIIDCYWESEEPQTNPIKLFLFTAYFPQLTTGPISRYGQLKTLYEPHAFEFNNLKFGAQRMLWGFAKKIVLAERVGVIVAAVTSAPQDYSGFYSWVTILLYPVQMYADFSGCMDIILGVSEIFGIKLAENFTNPFFTRTSQEFWQHWHITLGSWARDYVLYPMLKSGPIVRFGKKLREKHGKKVSKNIVNLICMFILWMVVGIWHGGVRFIVGVSLWYWIILMAGEFLQPTFKKIIAALKIKTESFGWHLFQSVRTYLIYAFGATFFCVGVLPGLKILGNALGLYSFGNNSGIGVLFDGSMLKFGLTGEDYIIIALMIVLLFVVGILREKSGYARTWVDERPFAVKLIVYLALFVLVLVWGRYGPGFDATQFIYGSF